MPELDSKAPNDTHVTEAKYASDLLFVHQLLLGNGAAWRRFIEEFGPLIRGRVADVARSFGRGTDESAIDDAAAEVVAALLKNDSAALRAFAGKSAFSTYLAVISTRCATRGYAAQRQATNQDSQQFESAPTQSGTQDPSAPVIAAEQTARVQSVVERLPIKQRKVVTLFHLQGHSYLEISERLNMPMGSVGVTLRRAEAKIRELLEPD